MDISLEDVDIDQCDAPDSAEQQTKPLKHIHGNSQVQKEHKGKLYRLRNIKFMQI